ncbi:hypothetical protein MHBO_003209 [Bonamia ostreae]|uniref:Uncharacterized protein n=1 Tax=Bonamia ostreae TaxID=126728 RepID=A0ABV2APT7_9EUKA
MPSFVIFLLATTQLNQSQRTCPRPTIKFPAYYTNYCGGLFPGQTCGVGCVTGYSLVGASKLRCNENYLFDIFHGCNISPVIAEGCLTPLIQFGWWNGGCTNKMINQTCELNCYDGHITTAKNDVAITKYTILCQNDLTFNKSINCIRHTGFFSHFSLFEDTD